jgi:hypothetical protein
VVLLHPNSILGCPYYSDPKLNLELLPGSAKKDSAGAGALKRYEVGGNKGVVANSHHTMNQSQNSALSYRPDGGISFK